MLTTDFADRIVGFAMQFLQRSLGFFLGAIFQLRELGAAFAVELVLDDVFGRLGHGLAFLERGDAQLSFELERRMILIL